MKNFLLILALSTALISNAQIYKDRNASPLERAESIVKEMTLEEKVSLMLFDSPAIPRLGIEQYNWWNEALHGVGRAGTCTVYPQPIGMAATFDDRLIYDVFCTVSDEARAKNHKAKKEGPLQIYQGLTFWTPNVNIFRDPRWGRGHETYGEDPYLTSKMGISVVRGLQGDFYEGGAFDKGFGNNAYPYYKTNGCAKHYAVHSGPEWNRHSFDAKDISQRDLWETYLPSFKALVKDGNVRQVMCAYNRFEGEPCCGSPRLLTSILRDQWDYDGIILTDCWAIDDFYYPDRHHTDDTKESAAAKAVRAGTDLECGPALRSLVKGVQMGLITEEEIDRSVIRLMKARYELGEMDPDEYVPWSEIPYQVVGCQKHQDLALDVARKTMVLLKNDGVLPLNADNKSLRVGLIGPNANDSVMQWGNYNGFPVRTSTLLSALQNRLSESQLVYIPGIDHTSAVKLESRFCNTIAPSGKPGFDVIFWKRQNVKDTTEPHDVEWHYNTPLQLTSAGATVWAPEVPLGRFTALFSTKFIPEKTEDITFSIQSMGAAKLYINQELAYEGNNQKSINAYTFRAEAGKEYDVELMFFANEGDNASLDFDFGTTVPLDIDNVVKSLKDCDVILFAGGLSPLLEGEEMSIKIPGFYRGDRTVIELPEVQTQVLEALSKMGIPVVLINYTGSCVGLEREENMVEAILQAWYPGQAGGEAVVDVLFGDYNPSGRLPITFFRSSNDLPDFEDYNFDNGRSYRYFKGDPLYHFGHGLSYTDFQYGQAKHKLQGQNHFLTIPVTNKGERAGDEIVQVYIGRESDPWGPTHALRAFKRVSLNPGQTENVEIEMTPEQFQWFDEETDTMRVIPGEYTIYYGPSSDLKHLKSLKIILK